jgi:hypothetical protein
MLRSRCGQIETVCFQHAVGVGSETMPFHVYQLGQDFADPLDREAGEWVAWTAHDPQAAVFGDRAGGRGQ